MDQTSESRRSDRRTLAILGGAAAGVLLLLLSLPPAGWLIDAISRSGLVACPFHAITGIPCPGCGGTRAVLCLANGDVNGALVMNPLVVIAVLGAVSLAVLALVAPRACDRVLDRSGRWLSTRAGRLILFGLLLAEMILGAR